MTYWVIKWHIAFKILAKKDGSTTHRSLCYWRNIRYQKPNGPQPNICDYSTFYDPVSQCCAITSFFLAQVYWHTTHTKPFLIKQSQKKISSFQLLSAIPKHQPAVRISQDDIRCPADLKKSLHTPVVALETGGINEFHFEATFTLPQKNPFIDLYFLL